MASTTDANNPGHVLASAVDAEVQKFRDLQQNLQKIRGDLQTLYSQEAENDMVAQELQLIATDSENSVVYKQVGPVLLPQNLDEAQLTVRERLDYIGKERARLETKATALEQKGNELSRKIQQMQSNLQQTTAQAVQAIAAQHQQSGS